MEIPPAILRLLQKMGVNTTRLQWKMYQRQKQREIAKEQGTRLPSRVHWLNYPHKFCWKCNALNDRDDKKCHKCGARLPSRNVYLVMRSLGVFVPQSDAPVTFGFMFIAITVYALTMAMSGGGLFGGIDYRATAVLGSYYPLYNTFVLADHPLVKEFYKEVLDGVREPFNFPQWRILASALLHGGILHIGFNMFCLFQIGPLLESNLRPTRFLVLVTLTELGGSAATYAWYIYLHDNPYMSTVGASGFLFGLIGFGIAYFRSGSSVAQQYRRSLIQWALYAGVFGLIIGANNAAHAGGFIVGYLIGMLPVAGPTGRALDRFYPPAAIVSAILWGITIVCMIASAVVNLGGD